VSPLFRRKSATVEAPAPAEPAPTGPTSPARARNPGKGRPTPKRSEANRRRRTAEPPPKDAKEARARLRARQRQERAEAFSGMKRGDEKYLTKRDRGPVRRLVRDLVDARRNVGSIFFSGALVVVLGTMLPQPAVRLAANILWLALIVAMIVDGFLISRLVRRTVRDRFPDTDERMGSLSLYAVMRSMMFRRMRNPQPQVNVGDPV
jgi:hypothetical protein